MFNPGRLRLARTRRRLTGRRLAELAGVSVPTITRLEKSENQPDESTVLRLASVLRYPQTFFFGDDIEVVTSDIASFRALSRLTAKEREAALSAGSLGIYLSAWVDERFSLPENRLLDLSHEADPEVAAEHLRQHWSLGVRPIGHMIRTLEAHGVRIFSLNENTASVDAFSFWKDDTPFIFLNGFKTPERSVFDAAHELGHLVMHKQGGLRDFKAAEREANAFASAFLMPENDVRPRTPPLASLSTILELKSRWRVSAMALTYRLRKLEILSEWRYKSICVELGLSGYRSREPNSIEREKSTVWPKVFSLLWSERITKSEIARDLGLPLDELEGLVSGVSGVEAPAPSRGGNHLRVVNSNIRLPGIDNRQPSNERETL